jgi:hypothetical protein
METFPARMWLIFMVHLIPSHRNHPQAIPVMVMALA